MKQFFISFNFVQKSHNENRTVYILAAAVLILAAVLFVFGVGGAIYLNNDAHVGIKEPLNPEVNDVAGPRCVPVSLFIDRRCSIHLILERCVISF